MSHLTRNLTLSAIAATLLSATAVFAAPPDMPPPGGQHHAWRMQHKLDKIHAQLNLNASQEQLWQTAISTMQADRQQAGALHQQARQQMASLMQAPILDLHALQSQRQQREAQTQQLRARTEAAWLNLYDSLDATQKVTVSGALKAQWQRMAQRHAKKEYGAGAEAPAAISGSPPAWRPRWHGRRLGRQRDA